MEEKKEFSIEDLLNSLKGDTNKSTKYLDPRTIWDMIANRKTWEDMGFTSEEEYKQWIVDNPYKDLE